VQVNFASKRALIEVLEKANLSGNVVKPPTPQPQPSNADKSTKALESWQKETE
jgi:hypothetical protein